jgi:hypothetical protein
MNTHPYWRAYMAGIVVPTIVLLLGLTGFVLVRYVFQAPLPIERAMAFPMAIVPNLFGVWNMFYLWLRPRRHLPIGFHGALLPFIIVPAGYLIGSALGLVSLTPQCVVYFQVIRVPYIFFAIGFTFALIGYYLIWKYLVGFFNRVLGIA